MSDLLGFFKPGFALLQVARQRLVLFLCALAAGDVLDRTKYFVRSARCVSFHSPDGLYSTHFAGGADDTMFYRSVHSTTNDVFSCPENEFPIIRVHHFPNHRHINGPFLWRQSVDAIKFGGPSHPVGNKVPFIVPDLGDTLSFLKPCFAFLQAARQGLAFFIDMFALGDVGHYAHIFEVAGAVSSSMRNYPNIFDDAVR